ncbi:UNVERIFIED_CONTAM: (+)-sabinene synthase, chloroplastic [Sesamum radiatum]|uniref:(+)-sabinene synthase, chloroplastic n=1 Tax=Sesamum radiatum TaxID=300843 RepID=A0AAW2RVS7_SESRA
MNMAADMIANTLFIPHTTPERIFGRKEYSKRCCSAVSCAAPPSPTTRCCSLQVQHHVPTPRRSGNYGPSLWDFDYIQSLNTHYTEERYLRRASELKVEVKKMLVQEKELSSVDELLELIDELQRVGISYHFEDEINQILASVFDHKYAVGKNNSESHEGKERDLYPTALAFRLLRQHGFTVSQEIFDCFRNEKGDFDPNLGHDTKGLLQLYEASFLSTPGEKTLDLAREFATNFLQENPNEKIDESLSILVRHALELPTHWRVQRPNTRWFIEAYERRPDVKSVVLELAKLDFNIVQATHQQELKHVYGWWKQTGIAEHLPFARDRMVECYFWTIGVFSHPQYSYPRIMASKFNALINTPVIFIPCIFSCSKSIESEVVQSLYKYHNLVRYSSIILRLADDLETSMDELKRGDVPKSIECYMNESGGSREEAVEYIRFVIGETWKNMNQEAFVAEESPLLFPQDFVRIAADLARMAQYMYHDGDGHGLQNCNINTRISTLLFHPIP